MDSARGHKKWEEAPFSVEEGMVGARRSWTETAGGGAFIRRRVFCPESAPGKDCPLCAVLHKVLGGTYGARILPRKMLFWQYYFEICC